MSVGWPVKIVEFSKLAWNWPEKFWEVKLGTETDIKPVQNVDFENFFIIGPTR